MGERNSSFLGPEERIFHKYDYNSKPVFRWTKLHLFCIWYILLDLIPLFILTAKVIDVTRDFVSFFDYFILQVEEGAVPGCSNGNELELKKVEGKKPDKQLFVQDWGLDMLSNDCT